MERLVLQRAAEERALADRVDLRAVELVPESRELVRRDVDAVLVGAEQRLIAEARAAGIVRHHIPRTVVRRSAVVGDVHREDLPVARARRRRRGLGDGDQHVRAAVEELAVRRERELENRHHEPLRGRVVVALRVGQERPERGRIDASVDLVLAGVEHRQRGRPARPVSRSRVDRERGVDRLDHQAAARAEALVGRRVARLVAVVGIPVVLERDAGEPERAGVRCRHRRRVSGDYSRRIRMAGRVRNVTVGLLARLRPNLVLPERRGGALRHRGDADDAEDGHCNQDRDRASRSSRRRHSSPLS